MQVGEPIHTFRRRAGRSSPTAEAGAALARPSYGVPAGDALLDLAALFGRVAPVALEIGAGRGEAALQMAAAQPEIDLVACEVHPAGAAALLHRLAQEGVVNVRVAEGDAVALLRGRVLPRSLSEVRVFFPDPWPKSRHAKRRLLSASFAGLIADRLRAGGLVHVATDSPAYAELTVRVLADAFDVAIVPRPAERPLTRYETRGLAAGRPAYDVIGVLRADRSPAG